MTMKFFIAFALFVTSCKATNGPRRLRRPLRAVEALLTPLGIEEGQEDVLSESSRNPSWFQRELEGSMSLSYSSFPHEPTPPDPAPAPTPPVPAPTVPGPVTTPSPNPPPPTGVPSTLPTPSPPIAAPTLAPGVPTTVPTPSPPIASPTVAPVPEITNSPVAAPSEAPVEQATTAPTTAQTASPTISELDGTQAPVAQTTNCGISDADRESDIHQELSAHLGYNQSGNPLDDAASPQGQAFTWIINEDKQQLCPGEDILVQRYFLALLYYSTGGDNWDHCSKTDTDCAQSQFSNSTNFLSSASECDWAGIRCNGDGVLRFIELDNNNLTGVIPHEVGSIESLRVLGLSANSLTGPIPSTLGNIEPFHVLRLDTNGLTGSIPPGLSDKLVRLVVANNKLSGALPVDGFGNRLRVLQVHNNAFAGDIPSALGDSQDMTIARFTGNNFSGVMPDSLCELLDVKLTVLTADCPAVSCACCTNPEC